MQKTLIHLTLFCLFILAPCARSEMDRRASANAVLSTCVHKKGCAVRFVYDPPISKNFPPVPAIWRPANEQDPRLGTWHLLMPQGVTQWISPDEMRDLLDGLENLDLSWEVSKTPLSFRRVRIEPPPPPPMLPWKIPMSRKKGTMEIDVTSEAGSAVAFLASKKVCASMKPLVHAFRIPISIYGFKGALLDWGCKVPGFNLADRPKPPKHEKR